MQPIFILRNTKQNYLRREYYNMPSAMAGTSFIKVSLIYSALHSRDGSGGLQLHQHYLPINIIARVICYNLGYLHSTMSRTSGQPQTFELKTWVIIVDTETVKWTHELSSQVPVGEYKSNPWTPKCLQRSFALMAMTDMLRFTSKYT